MITLQPNDTIRGVAQTNATVTVTIAGGLEIAGAVDTYKILYQGQPSTSIATLYTATGVTALIATISAVNTAASPQTFALYLNGAAAANRFTPDLTLPANGFAIYNEDGWKVFNAQGQLLISIPLGTGTPTALDNTAGSAGSSALAAPFDHRHQVNLATTALAGLLSAADKIKLNGGYKDIVSDFGADPTGAVDCTSLIQTAVDSFGTAGGRLYFPPGTYKMSATVTISKPVILVGAGRAISNITMAQATQDQFLMATGAQGAGFEQIRLTGSSSSIRTAGFAVNFGAISNVYMQQCDVLFHWSGVHSGGALQFIDDMNIREGGANAINGAAILVDSTGDRYIRRLGTDQGSNPTGYAGIRIRECSSCVITDCNIIHSGNALDINPNAGVAHAVASVDCVNCFFDTSVIGANITCATGNDTAQRIMFIRCWFGTHTTAGVVLGHANVNSVDFVGCEFYQSPFGIDAQACTEWAVRASRFAGNTTNAIKTTAGATHSFTIADNTIGNVAGFGANAQGINVQAGTYKRYQILDNKGFETNTTPGIIDLGTVAAADQKNVSNNMGALFGGAMASLGAPVATVGTAETLLLNCRIPANSVKVGDTFHLKVFGISSSTGTLIFRARAGANGTTADNQAWISITSAAQVANQRAGFEALLVVRSIGAGGTVQCEGVGYAQAALLPTLVAAVGTAAVNTTGVWFIDIIATCSVGTFTAQEAVIAVV